MSTRRTTKICRIGSIVTTSDNPLFSFCHKRVCSVCCLLVGFRIVFVSTIFENVTQHILQAKWIRFDRNRFLCPVLTVLRINNIRADAVSFGSKELTHESLIREIFWITFKEIRSLFSTTGCIFPFCFSRKAVFLTCLHRKPLTEGLSCIVCHGDSWTVSASPTLVWETKWRRRS